MTPFPHAGRICIVPYCICSDMHYVIYLLKTEVHLFFNEHTTASTLIMHKRCSVCCQLIHFEFNNNIIAFIKLIIIIFNSLHFNLSLIDLLLSLFSSSFLSFSPIYLMPFSLSAYPIYSVLSSFYPSKLSMAFSLSCISFLD